MRRHTDQAYLLRLWRNHAEAPLRATLTRIASPHSHLHVANLDALHYFLIAQTRPTPRGVQDRSHMPTIGEDHCTSDEA